MIVGEFSDAQKMNYSWKAIDYGEKYLDIQIDFEFPIFISMDLEAEYIEFKIRDGQIFLSEAGLPLELAPSDTKRQLSQFKGIHINY